MYENSLAYATSSDVMFSALRSGGFFREPSWYAIFAFPAINLLYINKKYKRLCILIIGILLSTSSLGYLYLIIFAIVSCVNGENIKLKVGVLVGSIVFMLCCIVLYFKFPFLFDRFIFAIEYGGSSNARIYEPFREAFYRFSFFGTDAGFLKNIDEVFFVNTFVYIYIISGLCGLILFILLLISAKTKYIYYSSCMLLAVLVEGMAGRIDFWLLLLIITLIRNNKMEEINA